MAQNRKKRKAENIADGADGSVEPAAPKKKSKRERLAEARAKAKAWHDSRNAGGTTGARAAKSPPRPSSSEKPSASASRRRTPSRKSTGGIGASRGAAHASRRARASVGGGTAFKFSPPAKGAKSSDEEASDEDEEEEERNLLPDTRDTAVQSTGPASKNSSGHLSTPAYEFGAGAGSKKRKEGEGSGEMRVDLKRLGLSMTGDQRPSDRNQQPRLRGNVRESLQKDHFALPPDDGERKATSKAIKSPDPPSAAEPTETVARGDLPSMTNSKLPASAAVATKPKPKSRRASNIPPPMATATGAARIKASSQRAENLPPRRVRSIVDALESRMSADLPDRQKFDVPGPSGSSSMNARLKSPVDPPYKKVYGGGSGDERKTPARPSPPGSDADGREVGDGRNRDATAADDGSDLNARKEEATSPAAASAPPATEEVKQGALSAAMSRAKELMSSAALSNRHRRAMMGIRSSDDNQEAIDGRIVNDNTSARTVGMPPRDVIQMERPADAALTAGRSKEGEKIQLDPPGSPPTLAVPQRKFRGAGSDRALLEGKDEERSGGNAMQLTDAGEATSEVGGNAAGRIIWGKDDDALSNKKASSSLKKGCSALLKCTMFAAFGFFYLVTDYSPPHMLKDANGPKSATTLQEDSFPCFSDYPALDRDSSENEEKEGGSLADGTCEGDRKQCPPRGRCKGGVLTSCDDGDDIREGTKTEGAKDLILFVPDDNGRECVISKEATYLIAAVQNTLVNMTVAQTCGSSDKKDEVNNIVLMEGDEFPIFDLAKLAEKMKEEHEEYDARWSLSSDLLLRLSPAFDSDFVRFVSLPGDDGNELAAVGLGASFPPNLLGLPIECKMKQLLWEALEVIGNCLYALMMFLMKKIWILVTTHPFFALFFVSIWKFVAMVRSKRKHRAKVRELFPVVLDKVYDRLSECDGNEGYAALYLRDDVGRDIYLTNFRERQFLIDYVWPRILLEIRADNRVRKFRRVANDGKELEHWDFDTQSKRGRRLRKSSGTTGSGGKRDKGLSTKQDP